MTQPAKSQEPSMEEILASIRRIIADDDASKIRATRAGAAEAEPPAPPPPPPSIAAAARRARAASPSRSRRADAIRTATPSRGSVLRHSRSHRIDGGADASTPQRRAADAESRRNFAPSTAVPTSASTRRAESPRRSGRAATRSACTAYFERRPAPRSIPPSMRWRRPCWCRMRARSRIWCAKCCGRC